MVTAARVLVTGGYSGKQLVNNWGRAGGLPALGLRQDVVRQPVVELEIDDSIQ